MVEQAKQQDEQVEGVPPGDGPQDEEHKADVNIGGDDQAPNTVEALAAEIGWDPDFNGPNAVDARTFILRSREINDKLSGRVRMLGRELEAMRDGVETIKWSMEQQNKAEINRLKGEILELRAKRDEAIREGQVEAVGSFDQRIETLQGMARTAETQRPPRFNGQVPPEYAKWVDGNSWYESDAELQQYADALSHTPEYKALPYTMRLDRIAKVVKTQFPEKFPTAREATPANHGNAKREAAVAPVTPSRQRSKPSGARKATAANLSRDEETAGRTFVAQGLFKNLDEYAQKLQEHEEARQKRYRGA